MKACVVTCLGQENIFDRDYFLASRFEFNVIVN